MGETDRDQQPGRTSVLRIPAVRRLVVAYVGSSLGSTILGVAIAFAAYERSDSIVLTVIALSSNAVPAFFLSPLVGRIATGRDPRTVYNLGQAAKVVQSAAMAAITFTGDLSYGLLVLTGLLNGSISAVIAPRGRS